MLHRTALSLFAVFISVCSTLASAPSGPWDVFNYAPDSRVVRPTAIHSTSGSVRGASRLTTTSGKVTLQNGTWIALDFGKEVRFLKINFIRPEFHTIKGWGTHLNEH